MKYGMRRGGEKDQVIFDDHTEENYLLLLINKSDMRTFCLQRWLVLSYNYYY